MGSIQPTSRSVTSSNNLDYVMYRLHSSAAWYQFFVTSSRTLWKYLWIIFSIYGSIFENCLANMERELETWVKVNLVLNWDKCHFMVKKGLTLVHLWSKRGIKVDKAKLEVIEKLTLITSIREDRSFFSHAYFYCWFINHFSKILKPMIGLLIKDVEFNFEEHFLESFQKTKEALISTLIMQPPYWSIPFEIMCDANDYGVGSILG